MNTALIALGVVITILLILMWRRIGRGRRCRNCRHFKEQYITSLHGQGLFRFGYCQQVIYDTRIVEPDIERECEWYEALEEVTQRMPEEEAAGEG